MISPMDLTDKNVLIAGAGSNMGFEIVNQVVKLGAKVVLLDRHAEKIQEAVRQIQKMHHASYYCFDIFNSNEIENEIKNIVSEQGSFHGFVFCAGIGAVRPLAQTRYNDMENLMNANCFSFVEMTRCLTKRNSFEHGGSIVAISSVSSVMGLKSKLAYSSSKAALNAAVRCIAAELANKGIRVNSILKGGTTDDKKIDYIRNIVDLNDDEIRRNQLLGETEPAEIAKLAAFLLSDSVKTLTGASIIVDSGYSL